VNGAEIQNAVSRSAADVAGTTLPAVRILSEEALPPAAQTAVRVHYFEAGDYKVMTDHMRRPTYYDRLVVSSVPEVAGYARAPVKIDSFRSAARYAYQTARRVEQSLRRPHVLRMPVLDMRIAEPNNMAHLLLDLVPYSLHARRVIGPEVAFLFRPIVKPFSEVLEVFGIEPRYELRRVAADMIKIRGARGLSVYELYGTVDILGINLVPDVYGEMEFASSTKVGKVFLARRGPRGLINHSEIEAVVASHGYQTIFMENCSIAEQLSIGAQSKHVVAVHGAAMALLAVNRQIDSVIELLPPNVYHACYPMALGPKVRRYEQIIPDFDRTVVHKGWQEILRFKDQPFSVDARLLDRLLSEIHSPAERGS
jgi:hypothetical protein